MTKIEQLTAIIDDAPGAAVRAVANRVKGLLRRLDSHRRWNRTKLLP